MPQNRAIILMILLILTSHNKAIAKTSMEHAKPDGETHGLLILLIPPLAFGGYLAYKGFATLIENDESLSKGRKNSLALLEAGKANESGSSFTAGALLSENHLIFGRYSLHASEETDFRAHELGYRLYSTIWFAELGLFHASHQQSDTLYHKDRSPTHYEFDSYYTQGAFWSVGISTMLGPLSLGVRGTFHRGLATQSVKSYNNSTDVPAESKQEARDIYRFRGTGYIEIGVVIPST